MVPVKSPVKLKMPKKEKHQKPNQNSSRSQRNILCRNLLPNLIYITIRIYILKKVFLIWKTFLVWSFRLKYVFSEGPQRNFLLYMVRNIWIGLSWNNFNLQPLQHRQKNHRVVKNGRFSKIFISFFQFINFLNLKKLVYTLDTEDIWEDIFLLFNSIVWSYHFIHPLKGQSNEIFDCQFFFIIQTSMGHWSIGLNIFNFG